MLSLILCIITFSTSAQNKDSVLIHKDQVKNIYVGLKQGEEAKKRLSECLYAANELNSIIQAQNDSIQNSLAKISILNDSIQVKQSQLLSKSIEIEIFKKKKVPWYKHPACYAFVAFIAGVFTAN